MFSFSSAPLLLLAQPLVAGSVFLQAQGKLLLLLHALLAILLLGSMTHNALITVRYLGGNFSRIRLEKLYVKVAFAAYLPTFTLGALIYPNYRYHVRERYFDLHLPWASQLFDIKEHWAALGLALFVVFFLFSRELDPRTDRPMLFIYVFLSLTLTLIVWFTLVSGLLLSSYRSV